MESESSDLNELRLVLKEKEAELSERKRYDAELYGLINTLEKRFSEASLQLATARQELRLEKLRQLECQLEITHLTDIMMREQDALSTVKQELDSLTYSISHDLRAPVRHLLGFTAALYEDYVECLDSTAHGYLASIRKAAQKMESQIEALLTLSRISRQELQMTTLDLAQIANHCAAALQSSSPDRNVVFQIPEHMPVQGDLRLITVAIDHLMGNAWKFTRKRERGCIELGQKREGEGTVYYLRDNGAGFDMAYADRLFGPFQRMHNDNDFAGTGMGLATVQRIVRRHGGKIWADAAVNGGATFYFTLSARFGNSSGSSPGSVS